ncbi:MAG: DUF4962 domain-containing protein [Kiritimatiellae bacterium]|nr:DUF4962 domain-containing protein [Kiritimatiellia bacterium]
MQARQRLTWALMLGLVSVSAMSTAPTTRAAETLAIEPGHPRIFFTAKDLPALKKRIETTHARQWAGLKKWADGPASGKWSNKQLRQHLPAYAFLYRLGGGTNYAAEAISMARRIAAFDIGDLSKGDVSAGDLEGTPKAMAIAYDWCYDRLTAEDKAAILKGLDAHCGWLLKNRIEPHTHPMNNHRSTSACSMGMGGLAMHGDHPNAERYAAAALRVCEEFVCIHRHFSAPGDGMAGCEGGSMEYTRST